jgi:hypothetical protein
MEIPLPPIPVQERFKYACARVEKVSERLKRDLAQASILTSSLSQRAFRGEL